ncbi:hypothetical protein [Crossiella sp. CA198]|uniref:hypothetical protein n=1 Tax=Crossiella sp. CA198 TaxID=3455607 RepID=UPI003F8D8189
MSGEDQVVRPRHVLCVLGSGLAPMVVQNVVAEVGGPGFSVDPEYSSVAHDPRMPEAFRACLATATFTGTDWESLSAHDSVAYVLSPPMTPATSLDLSRRMLAVTAALLRSGATAVKNESSGLTHGRDRWLRLADNAATAPGPAHLADALYHAWVKRPISTGELLFSCGMHLLAAPDVEVESSGEPDSLEDRVALIDGLAIYLLTERRAREIQEGEGFRLAPDAPRWVLRKRPCHRYDDDDFFFNPHGYWRLTPAESPCLAE